MNKLQQTIINGIQIFLSILHIIIIIIIIIEELNDLYTRNIVRTIK